MRRRIPRTVIAANRFARSCGGALWSRFTRRAISVSKSVLLLAVAVIRWAVTQGLLHGRSGSSNRILHSGHHVDGKKDSGRATGQLPSRRCDMSCLSDRVPCERAPTPHTVIGVRPADHDRATSGDCVILDSRLRDGIEPMAFDFVMNFAVDNDLVDGSVRAGTGACTAAADEAAHHLGLAVSARRKAKPATSAGFFMLALLRQSAILFRYARVANKKARQSGPHAQRKQEVARRSGPTGITWAAGACRPLMAAARRL